MYRLVARHGEKKVAILGLTMQVITYTFLIVVPAFAWLYPLIVAGALGNAFTRPTLEALVANSVGQHQQGQAAGTSASIHSLANIIGPLTAGFVYDQISPAAPFLGGSFLLLAASLLLMRIKATNRTTEAAVSSVTIQ